MSETIQAIQIRPNVSDVSIEVPPEAIEIRDDLIRRSRAGNRIINSTGADKVAGLLQEITSFIRTMDNAASSASGPVRALLNQISDLKKELITDLEIEKKRLGALSAAWRQEQEEKAREEQRKRAEELRRLKEEQEQAEARRREAEEALKREREAMPEKMSLEDLKNQAEGEDSPEEPEIMPDPEEEARLEKMRALQAEELKQKTELARHTPAGMHVRKNIEIDVFDVEALYKANPVCVKLSPNVAVIKALIKTLKPGEEIPGVRFTETASTVVRS